MIVIVVGMVGRRDMGKDCTMKMLSRGKGGLRYKTSSSLVTRTRSMILFLTILAYLLNPVLSGPILERSLSLARPNCIDSMLMRYNVCTQDALGLSITPPVIAVANCLLTTQLNHLGHERIECERVETACMQSLKEYQRKTIMFVMANMPVYCEVHRLRMNHHMFAKHFSSVNDLYSSFGEGLKDIGDTNKALQSAQLQSLQAVTQLQSSKSEDSELNSLLRETELLKQEINSPDSEDGTEWYDLKYLSNLCDFYSYLVMLFIKTLVVVMLSTVSTAPCPVSLLDLLGDFTVGTVVNTILSSLPSVLLQILPSELVMTLRIVVFLWINAGKLIRDVSRGDRSTRIRREETHHLESLAKAVQTLEANLSTKLSCSKKKYKDHKLDQSSDRRPLPSPRTAKKCLQDALPSGEDLPTVQVDSSKYKYSHRRVSHYSPLDIGDRETKNMDRYSHEGKSEQRVHGMN